MKTKCEVESAIEKLNIRELQEILDEAIALGVEYVKICGRCGGFEHCVLLSLTMGLDECRLILLGSTLSIPVSAPVDDLVLALLKYAKVITRKNGTVVFHIPKDYSLGVYYLTCRNKTMKWEGSFQIDRDEAIFFLEE